jgi:predicted alpha/beta-hydrolase family hydrolase
VSDAVTLVPTPLGDARVHATRADSPVGTLLLGHGAGGGVGTADLAALAGRLPPLGVSVLLVDQPWVVAGRKVAAPPPTLDRGWLAVLAALAAQGLQGPLLVGGRSAGARVACRTAEAVGAAGVLALAFPLHPPAARPSRLPELDLPAAAGLPVLVLQGTRDSFGGPADIPAAPGRVVLPVEGADHSFRVLKGGDRAAVLARIVDAAAAWALTVCAVPDPS